MYSSDAMQPVRVWKVPADVCVRRQAAESPKQGGGEVKVGVGGVKEGWRAATPTFVRAPMVDLDHIPLLVQARSVRELVHVPNLEIAQGVARHEE